MVETLPPPPKSKLRNKSRLKQTKSKHTKSITNPSAGKGRQINSLMKRSGKISRGWRARSSEPCLLNLSQNGKPCLKIKNNSWEMTQPVKCLRCKCEDLNWIPRTHIKILAKAETFNPSTGHLDTRGPLGLTSQ